MNSLLIVMIQCKKEPYFRIIIVSIYHEDSKIDIILLSYNIKKLQYIVEHCFN